MHVPRRQDARPPVCGLGPPAILQEQRATATGYKDVTSGATAQEGEENKADQDAEIARHNQQDESLKNQQQQNTQQYQRGELGVRGGELALVRHGETSASHWP